MNTDQNPKPRNPFSWLWGATGSPATPPQPPIAGTLRQPPPATEHRRRVTHVDAGGSALDELDRAMRDLKRVIANWTPNAAYIPVFQTIDQVTAAKAKIADSFTHPSEKAQDRACRFDVGESSSDELTRMMQDLKRVMQHWTPNAAYIPVFQTIDQVTAAKARIGDSFTPSETFVWQDRAVSGMGSADRMEELEKLNATGRSSAEASSLLKQIMDAGYRVKAYREYTASSGAPRSYCCFVKSLQPYQHTISADFCTYVEALASILRQINE